MSPKDDIEALNTAGETIARIRRDQGAYAIIMTSNDSARTFGVALLDGPTTGQPEYSASLGAAVAKALAARADKIRADAKEARLKAAFEAFRAEQAAA